jgi:hypothetical protein
VTRIRISDAVIGWAARAGYSLTPVDDSGAAGFRSDPGGELRYFVRGSADDGYTVSSAERRLDERVLLRVKELVTAERYLFDVFGVSLRSQSRLPRRKPKPQPAAGYTVDDVDEHGYRRLVGPNGVVAIARGSFEAAITLTLLSHLVAATVPDIEASYQSADGRPLFGT